MFFNIISLFDVLLIFHNLICMDFRNRRECFLSLLPVYWLVPQPAVCRTNGKATWVSSLDFLMNNPKISPLPRYAYTGYTEFAFKFRNLTNGQILIGINLFLLTVMFYKRLCSRLKRRCSSTCLSSVGVPFTYYFIANLVRHQFDNSSFRRHCYTAP